MNGSSRALSPGQIAFIKQDLDQAEKQDRVRMALARNRLKELAYASNPAGETQRFLAETIENAVESQRLYRDLSLKAMTGTTEPTFVTPHQGLVYYMDSPKNRILSQKRLLGRQESNLYYIQQLDQIYQKHVGKSLISQSHPDLAKDIAAAMPPGKSPVPAWQDSSSSVPEAKTGDVKIAATTRIGALPEIYWTHRNQQVTSMLDRAEDSSSLVSAYQDLAREKKDIGRDGRVRGFVLNVLPDVYDRRQAIERINAYQTAVEQKVMDMGYRDISEAARERLHATERVERPTLAHTPPAPLQEQSGRDSLWDRLSASLKQNGVLSGLFNRSGEKLGELRHGLSRLFGRTAAQDEKPSRQKHSDFDLAA